MRRIDAHFHLWSLSDEWQAWPTAEEAAIYRDADLLDFFAVTEPHDIAAGVLVQSSESVADTLKLIQISKRTDRISGVVGWVDFQSPHRALEDLLKLIDEAKLVGLRPMLQSMGEIDWLLGSAVRPLVEVMIREKLVFDALIKPHQILTIIAFAKSYPDLRIVVDHAAKPAIGRSNFKEWSDDMSLLAQCPNVSCKFSGLMTEAPKGAIALNFRPVFCRLIRAFGFERLIWGSDWPVINLAGSYGAWIEICEELMFGQPVPCWKAFFYENALTLYKLDQPRTVKNSNEDGALA